LVDLGLVSSWQDVEAVLQQHHLVHQPAVAAAGLAGSAGVGSAAQQAAGVAGEAVHQQQNMQGPCLQMKVEVTQLD
jgi:hypothetical protein